MIIFQFSVVCVVLKSAHNWNVNKYENNRKIENIVADVWVTCDFRELLLSTIVIVHLL